MFLFCVGTTPRHVRKLHEKASDMGKKGGRAVPSTLRHRSPGLTGAPSPPAAFPGVRAGDLWHYSHILDFT